jgi:hypothetical protein
VILTPNASRRVFAFPAPVDLRKGYDGLFGLVEQGLRCDPIAIAATPISRFRVTW